MLDITDVPTTRSVAHDPIGCLDVKTELGVIHFHEALNCAMGEMTVNDRAKIVLMIYSAKGKDNGLVMQFSPAEARELGVALLGIADYMDGLGGVQ